MTEKRRGEGKKVPTNVQPSGNCILRVNTTKSYISIILELSVATISLMCFCPSSTWISLPMMLFFISQFWLIRAESQMYDPWKLPGMLTISKTSR